MLRADSSFGCRSNTPYEILAASRSWFNADTGCSCSAAVRYLFADSSGPGVTNILGTCAGFVFTTARLAHPQHWNNRSANPYLAKLCHLFWKLERMVSFYLSHSQSSKFLTGGFAKGLQRIDGAAVHHVLQFRQSLIRRAISVNNHA